jgi:ATP-dependent Clp protease ATP-binding subunit ClpC
MRMTVAKPDGESHVMMLCGMCAYRFSNVLPQQARAMAAQQGGSGQLTPQMFSGQQFPTQRYGVFAGFSDTTQQVLKSAESISARLGLPTVGSVPVLMAILSLQENKCKDTLERYGVNLAELEAMAPKAPAAAEQPATHLQLSANSLSVLEMAQNKAVGLNSHFIEPEHLVLAMLEITDAGAGKYLKDKGVNLTALEADLNTAAQGDSETASITEATPEEMLFGAGGETQAASPEQQEEQKSALQEYARDMTELARQGKLMPVVGREAELGRVVRILSRMEKNNPLILGEAGVGKTAVVEGLAEHMAAGQVPRSLQGARLYEVDLTSLIAGTEMRGEFEKRIKKLIDEVEPQGDRVILYIDEIHNMVGAGSSEGSMDAGNILKPALARGQMHLIGSTTLAEYKKYIQKDPALSRRFEPVLVGEPTMEQAIQMLDGLKSRFEEHAGVQVSSDAVSAAVTLSSHYITDRFLPDKAIDCLDEACSSVSIENEEKKQSRAVIADDVAAVISSWTGIPLQKMIQSDRDRLIKMEDELHKRIINQEEAVGLVSDVVRRARAGLKDPNKPNGAFIFAGPTGVGKTELSLALANFLFNNDSSLIRFDMSEYMERESVARLIGAAPGYVGFEEGGQLTEKVKFHPYSVVLFDEMEKAHPQVLNLLLQIADAGRLTDGQGNLVDFKNTIIILTTNAGATLFFDDSLTGDSAKLKEAVTNEIIGKTSPELVNRMDAVICFKPLTPDQVRGIIGLQVQSLGKRLADQDVKLQVADDALNYLAAKGYDPQMGARPAKRVIQDELETPLSDLILSGKLQSGQEAVVTLSDKKLVITPQGTATAPPAKPAEPAQPAPPPESAPQQQPPPDFS